MMKRIVFYTLMLATLLFAMPVQADDIQCTGVWVGGVELTSQNNYTSAAGSQGLLSAGYAVYNPETKNLYLHQLSLNTDGVYNAIELLNDDDITITIFGSCHFNTRRAIYKPRGYKGTITVRLAENYKDLPTKLLCTCTCACIETYADLYIYKAPIDLTANCHYDESPYDIAAIIARNVTVDNAVIKLKANTQKALKLVDNGRLNLIGNHITIPANTQTDADGNVSFADTPMQVATELSAARIDLYIGETQVSAGNQDNIKSRLLKSGSIRFERGTNTLVLDNAVLSDDAETLDPYTSMIDIGDRSNFKIQLVGNNVIRSKSHRGITLFRTNNATETAQRNAVRKTRSTSLTDRVTIFGKGTLTMEGKADISTWQDLYINQATISMEDSIRGLGKKAPAIEINASEISTAGIKGFDSFNLIDCVIAAPANATYNEKTCEMSALGNVVITTNPTAIHNAPAATPAKATKTYTLDGRRIGNASKAKGIYIENGKKVARRN